MKNEQSLFMTIFSNKNIHKGCYYFMECNHQLKTELNFFYFKTTLKFILPGDAILM